MEPYEVWDAAVPWQDSHDRRPWVIVDSRAPDLYGCFPMSGQAYDPSLCPFMLDPEHPDFQATGLTKKCYVMVSRIHELSSDAFLSRRGKLVGDLLDAFLDAAGLA
jgi:hypothetical protein